MYNVHYQLFENEQQRYYQEQHLIYSINSSKWTNSAININISQQYETINCHDTQEQFKMEQYNYY